MSNVSELNRDKYSNYMITTFQTVIYAQETAVW